MCIGVPAQIVAIDGGPMPMAELEMAGARRTCCLAYLPEATVGDWVFVLNGFAMDLLDEADARESLAAIGELDLLSGAGEASVLAPAAGRATPPTSAR